MLKNLGSIRLGCGSLLIAAVIALPFALLWRPLGWIWVPIFLDHLGLRRHPRRLLLPPLPEAD
jgi:hypothetical protein